MTDVFLFGISGKMGRAVLECAGAQDCRISGGFDRVISPSAPTFSAVSEINVPFDVIIDFSRPETLDTIIQLTERFPRPVVLATTGYDQTAQEKIARLQEKIPVFQSGNMSLGINVLLDLTRRAVKALGGGFDCEIIEKHHNQKVDSPSGTAKMIASAVAQSMPQPPTFVYGREGGDTKRRSGEVGIHAVRGGTVVGEHEVMLCGEDEIITISHTAQSRKIFANGALRAAAFIKDKAPGHYDMADLLASV